MIDSIILFCHGTYKWIRNLFPRKCDKEFT
jgi:hypothetical protein